MVVVAATAVNELDATGGTAGSTMVCCSVAHLLSRVQLFEPHGLQHTRLPCPSPSPGVCSNSRSRSQ